MTKDNNNDKNKMTEEELEILADKIAIKIAKKLADLNDISDYFRTSYTFKPFTEFYKPKKYKELEQEDELIRKMLEQVLDVAYNGDIPVAGEYKKNEQ